MIDIVKVMLESNAFEVVEGYLETKDYANSILFFEKAVKLDDEGPRILERMERALKTEQMSAN